MADERDPQVSQRYGDLGAEEPPRALDEAILAAARRSAPSLSQPARSWTRRWAVPLSLAAVVVLSVTVTLRIQHEQPGIEAPETRPAPAAAKQETVVKEKEAAPAEAAAKRLPVKTEKADQPAPRKEPQPFQPALREREQAPAAAASAAASPAAAPPPAEAPARASSRGPATADMLEMRRDTTPRAESRASGAVAPQAAPMPAQSKLAAESPERELERIAQLRRDGRHEEADKALAEFRKRYPDFRIPEAMLERVERR